MLTIQQDNRDGTLIWEGGTLLFTGSRQAALEFITQRFGYVSDFARDYLENEVTRIGELL